MSKIRILLLSGGSAVGHNVLDVLADRRDEVELHATNSAATDAHLFDFDRVHLTPATASDPDAFASAFADILEQSAPDLIVPCRDDDVLFLAGFGERHPEHAGRFLCGSFATAEATVDKRASWQFSQAHGLPFVASAATPLTPQQARAFAAEHGFPLLIKPRWGHASRGVRILTEEAQLLRAAEQDAYIVQPYLGGPDPVTKHLEDAARNGLPLFHSFEGLKHSIQLFVAPDGSSAGRFFSCNLNRNGTSLRLDRHEGAQAEAIADRCHAAFSGAGWRGPLNIQCQQAPDGRIVIYEYNGRLSGASAARHAMGFDEVALAIACFTRRRLRPSAPTPQRVDTVMRRSIDIGLRRDRIEALEHDRIWHRPLP